MALGKARKARPPRRSPAGHPLPQAPAATRRRSALGPSKSRCHQSDVQSRRGQLSTFSPDWCAAGPRGGIKHLVLLSGGRRRVSRAVPTVPNGPNGLGRRGGGHCHGAPGSTTLPLAGTFPKPKRLHFKPSGIGSPSMVPLHSAKKSSVRSWEKTNVLFGLEGTSPSSPKTLLRMR